MKPSAAASGTWPACQAASARATTSRGLSILVLRAKDSSEWNSRQPRVLMASW